MINRICVIITLTFIGCGPTLVVDRANDNTPILIRSAQPDEDDIIELHKKYGLATIINLRGADIPENSVDAPSWWLEQEKVCKGLGITLWAMNFNDGTEVPAQYDIDIFFSLIEKPRYWPVLIHCQAGIHRTGFLSALYRIQYQKWPADKAIEEMESFWYDWSISDRSKIKDFLRKYKRKPEHNVPR